MADEMFAHCVMTRSRLIARAFTNIYDSELRRFGVIAPQLALLVVISRLGPVSRADIGRITGQDRSTLARNLKIIGAEAWVREVTDPTNARRRPVVLTRAGEALLRRAAPAWRASQAKARALIGKEGIVSVTSIGDALLNFS